MPVLQRAAARLRAGQRRRWRTTGIRVAALSVDDKETTAALVAKHKLTFPVGYGADARAVAELTGAFVNPDPVYLQSTGFVLDPAGNVIVSVYSSGAIGRLVPDDVIGLVRYAREHSRAATRDRTGDGSMTDADVRFYFDPVCPFAWMTSKWVRMVAAQRDYAVDWRFISLRMINSEIDYDSHFPVGYEEGHTSGLRLLRVAARATGRARAGRGRRGSTRS